MAEQNEVEMVSNKKDIEKIQITDEGIVPATFGEMWYMAGMITRSSFAPKGMQKREDVFLALVHGRSVGLRNPLQAIQSLYVVNGRPAVFGDAIPGILLASSTVEDIDEHFEGEFGKDDFMAVCVIKRKQFATPFRAEFSIADAKAAGVWGKEGPWRQYPKRMLQIRARSFAARNGFADILKGFLIAEEAMDTPPIDVTGDVEVVSSMDGLKDELKAKKRGRPKKSEVAQPAEHVDAETGEITTDNVTQDDNTLPWEVPSASEPANESKQEQAQEPKPETDAQGALF